jgi:hypothetical protein
VGTDRNRPDVETLTRRPSRWLPALALVTTACLVAGCWSGGTYLVEREHFVTACAVPERDRQVVAVAAVREPDGARVDLRLSTVAFDRAEDVGGRKRVVIRQRNPLARVAAIGIPVGLLGAGWGAAMVWAGQDSSRRPLEGLGIVLLALSAVELAISVVFAAKAPGYQLQEMSPAEPGYRIQLLPASNPARAVPLF